MLKFIKAYVKSMRLYYSFITGIAGWLGVAYYDYIAHDPILRTTEIIPSSEKKMLVLVLLFLSWGVNQIINDYLGLKEDRVNAPDRPMVTGELNPKCALSLTGVLLTVTALLTYFFLQPIALIFLLSGVILNIIYEFAKGHGIVGNFVFGLMIMMAPLYGGYSLGPTNVSVFSPNVMSILMMVLVLNGVMTFYTYFKDYQGDLEAGKKTLVVKFGLQKSRFLAIISAFLPTLVFLLLRVTGLHQTELNTTFYILGSLTFFMQIWTGYLYYKNPEGKQSYESLKTNFRGCVCGQATLIAIFNPDISMWLFLFSYIFVGFLFELHSNHQS